MQASDTRGERQHIWQPTADEVERIVVEMRPIIQDFARRAAVACDLAAASHR